MCCCHHALQCCKKACAGVTLAPTQHMINLLNMLMLVQMCLRYATHQHSTSVSQTQRGKSCQSRTLQSSCTSAEYSMLTCCIFVLILVQTGMVHCQRYGIMQTPCLKLSFTLTLKPHHSDSFGAKVTDRLRQVSMQYASLCITHMAKGPTTVQCCPSLHHP